MTPLLWQRPSQNQASSRYHATTNGSRGGRSKRKGA